MKNEERRIRSGRFHILSVLRKSLSGSAAVLRFSFFVLLWLCFTPALAQSRLSVIQKAPDFRLIDQDGKQVEFASFKGKVLLVSFIFTTCNGTCPATTHRMSRIQDELMKDHLTDKGVHLISISLDPARDSPEKLAGYMRLYDADAKSWTFLTGSLEEVRKTIAAWGMWAKPSANGQLDHPSRVFLVDKQQRIREIYNLDFLRPQWVLEDVQLLLSEK
jgi:protein SCO1/2